MRKKIFKLFLTTALTLIVVFLVLFYVYANFDLSKRINNDSISGVRVNLLKVALKPQKTFSQIKEAGFNTVIVSPPGYLVNGKVYVLPFTYSLAGFLVKKAHEEGLKAGISPEIVYVGKKAPVLKTRLERDFLLSFYQNWSIYGEKVQADYLIISNSAISLLPGDERDSWLIESAKEIKIYFKGKVGFTVANIFEGKPGADLEVNLLSLKNSLTGTKVYIKLPAVKGFDLAIFELYPPIEAKNIALFPVDFAKLDEIIKRYSLRQGFGNVVYAGINLPLYGKNISSVIKAPPVTEREQKVYLEKMIFILKNRSCSYIIYDWDSESLGLQNNNLLKIIKEVQEK